jgi:uncharacterized protein (UPF0335 family)
MSKTTSGWKQNIPLEDFIVGGEHNIPLERSSTTSDKKVSKIAAIVKMTFAGAVTGNAAIYLPDEMYNGTRSWTIPYERPIQVHHKDLVDPIGRVKDARYVDTSVDAISKFPKLAQAMAVFHNPRSTTLARLKTVAIFQEADAAIENFEGVGRIDGLWDVSDADAVQKIIDKRYLTVSTAFTPKGAYCSQCAREDMITDWRKDECEHERGQYYDGLKCLAVPFGFNYDEVSPVNTPAARNATIMEIGENLSFSDSVAKSSVLKRPSIDIIDFVALEEDSSVRFSDSKTCKFPTSFKDFYNETNPEKQTSVIETNTKGKPEESKMNKLSRLLKDAAALEKKMAEFLPEGYVKTSDEDLAKLEEADFVGPDRTLKVTDMVEADAVKALLESCEDCDLKGALLESLGSKVTQLTPKEEDSSAPVEAEVPESNEQGEKDNSPSEEAPEVDLSKTVAELTEKLRDSTERVEELELEKSLLKKRMDDVQKDYRSQVSLNEAMTKKLRDNLVEKLLDSKASRGLKFQDRKAETAKYQDRSLSSIEDSIKEISDLPTPSLGTSGVQVTRETPPSERDSDESVDISKYTNIYERFLDVRYSQGESAAKQFLNEQKSQGFIPDSVKF